MAKIFLLTFLIISVQSICNGMPTSCALNDDCFQSELHKFEKTVNNSIWLTIVKVETKFINLRFDAMRHLVTHNEELDSSLVKTLETIDELKTGTSSDDCFEGNTQLAILTEQAKSDSQECVFDTFEVMLDVYQGTEDDFLELYAVRDSLQEDYNGCGDDECKEGVLGDLKEQKVRVPERAKDIGEGVVEKMKEASEDMKQNCMGGIKSKLESSFEEIVSSIKTCLE